MSPRTRTLPPLDADDDETFDLDDRPARRRRGQVTRPERADQDLVIERTDLGPGIRTRILQGHPIPPPIAHLPRHPHPPRR